MADRREATGLFDEGDDLIDAVALLEVAENKRPGVAHAFAVGVHDGQIGAHQGAKSTLLITNKSERVMPGPPCGGFSRPPTHRSRRS